MQNTSCSHPSVNSIHRVRDYIAVTRKVVRSIAVLFSLCDFASRLIKREPGAGNLVSISIHREVEAAEYRGQHCIVLSDGAYFGVERGLARSILHMYLKT